MKGNHNVGLTTLLQNHMQSFSGLNFNSITGVGLSSKEIVLEDGKSVRLGFWDVSDSEKFTSLKSTFYSHLQGALLIYDITDNNSLKKIGDWCQLIRENSGDIPIILAGNKLDLEESRQVTKEVAQEIKEKFKISYTMEISAKTGENVEDMFLKLTHLMVENSKEFVKREQLIYQQRMASLSEEEKEKRRKNQKKFRNLDIIFDAVAQVNELTRQKENTGIKSEKAYYQGQIDSQFLLIYEEIKKPDVSGRTDLEDRMYRSCIMLDLQQKWDKKIYSQFAIAYGKKYNKLLPSTTKEKIQITLMFIVIYSIALLIVVFFVFNSN